MYTRTKKKRWVTFTDSFNVLNVTFIIYIYNLSSLSNKLTKFHSIFSDDYHNRERDINLTDGLYSRPSNKVFVAYFMYPEFLFRPSIFIIIH